MRGGGNLSSLSREPSGVGHCRVSARSVVRPRLLPRRRILSAHRESGQVQTIFNDIADDYDLLNDALSLGLHRSWKRAAVQWTRAKKGQRALDACTGTGDIAALLATAVGAEGHVVGLDFAPEILDVARRRAAPRAGTTAAQVEWVQGDAMALPFDDASFDAATCGYGLRNVVDREKALAEFARVLRPGARLAVLDFNHAADASAANAAQTWALENVVVPVARSRGFEDEYAYLLPSIQSYPRGAELERMAVTSGFTGDVRYYELAFGLMGCLVAER